MSRKATRKRGRQAELDDELKATNLIGGYHGSIVCTDHGLLVASAGDIPSDEALAGFASLFDEIVVRAGRDLGLRSPDEVTLLDRDDGRLVIRPLLFPASDSDSESAHAQATRMFLVLWMDADATWRRNTSRLITRIQAILAPVVTSAATQGE